MDSLATPVVLFVASACGVFLCRALERRYTRFETRLRPKPRSFDPDDLYTGGDAYELVPVKGPVAATAAAVGVVCWGLLAVAAYFTLRTLWRTAPQVVWGLAIGAIGAVALILVGAIAVRLLRGVARLLRVFLDDLFHPPSRF